MKLAALLVLAFAVSAHAQCSSIDEDLRCVQAGPQTDDGSYCDTRACVDGAGDCSGDYDEFCGDSTETETDNESEDANQLFCVGLLGNHAKYCPGGLRKAYRIALELRGTNAWNWSKNGHSQLTYHKDLADKTADRPRVAEGAADTCIVYNNSRKALYSYKLACGGVSHVFAQLCFDDACEDCEGYWRPSFHGSRRFIVNPLMDPRDAARTNSKTPDADDKSWSHPTAAIDSGTFSWYGYRMETPGAILHTVRDGPARCPGHASDKKVDYEDVDDIIQMFVTGCSNEPVDGEVKFLWDTEANQDRTNERNYVTTNDYYVNAPYVSGEVSGRMQTDTAPVDC